MIGFHCCLFEPRGCAEELSMRVCVLTVGNWTHTFKLPGYWKYMAKLQWEPANVASGPRPTLRAEGFVITSSTVPLASSGGTTTTARWS